MVRAFGKIPNEPPSAQKKEFASVIQLQQSPCYDSLCWLRIECNEKHEPAPVVWPRGLQHLELERTSWSEEDLPPVPFTLRTLILHKCWNMEALPVGVGMCEDLEDIHAHGCKIRKLQDDSIPPGLRALDVSYNQLRSFDYERLPSTLMQLDVSYNFLTLPPPVRIRERCQVNAQGNEFPYTFLDANLMQPYEHHARRAFLPPLGNPVGQHQGVIPTVNVYNQSHNVHTHTIQNSAGDSVEALHQHYMACKDIDPPCPPSNAPHPAITDKSEAKKFWFSCCLPSLGTKARKWVDDDDDDNEEPWLSEMIRRLIKENKQAQRESGRLKRALRTWVKDSTVHSRHAITLGHMLHELWTVVRVHPNQQDIIPVLVQEILDSDGYCFTGRFTRVLNSLSGFVDGIRFEISERERLQVRMPLLYGKLPEDTETLGDDGKQRFMEQVFETLKESQLEEREWVEWMSPFAEALDVSGGDSLEAWKNKPKPCAREQAAKAAIQRAEQAGFNAEYENSCTEKTPLRGNAIIKSPQQQSTLKRRRGCLSFWVPFQKNKDINARKMAARAAIKRNTATAISASPKGRVLHQSRSTPSY